MRSISSCIHTLNNVIYIVTVDKKKTWINCNIYQFIYGVNNYNYRPYFDKNQGRYHSLLYSYVHVCLQKKDIVWVM